MHDAYTKLPRLFITQDITGNTPVTITSGQAHYLKSVMRKTPGDSVRIFNGREGEFLAEISALDKKAGTLTPKEQIKTQPAYVPQTHLIFTPLKKQPMDFLIEKSVELGVTDLHPILTDQTVVRKINAERLQAQIIEAAEQCERMETPKLHELEKLDIALQRWNRDTPLIWCYERSDSEMLDTQNFADIGFLIGPEGGFTESEAEKIQKHAFIKTVSLGERLLRAETAALTCLSHALLNRKNFGHTKA